jgi:signal peptidase I
MLRRRPIQRLIIAGCLFCFFVVVCRLLAVQGWLIPARVTSGSMAGSLLGEHFSTKCGDCGYLFHFGIESKPRSDLAVCPNCGWDKNVLQVESRGRGQRVLIDRGAYWLSSPTRFDIVAFYDPSLPSRYVVKRIVGLPGERIAIRGGDLFVNGKIVHKSLSQFRTSASVVHDNNYLAHDDSEIKPRWKPASADSGWLVTGNAIEWNPPSNRSTATDAKMSNEDWLVYDHWRCFASSYPRFQTAPISDNSGYNQGESRALQDVTDVVLSCTVRVQGSGRFVVRIHDGSEWLSVWLAPQHRQAEIKRGEQTIASAVFPSEYNRENDSFDVEFGLLDQQVVLALNSIEVIRKAYEPSEATREAIAQPLAIRSENLTVVVQHLVIQRDVYYLDSANIGQPWQLAQPIPERSYFVLGDNPSLSEDSRQWKIPCIPFAAIRGKVVPWR